MMMMIIERKHRNTPRLFSSEGCIVDGQVRTTGSGIKRHPETVGGTTV